MPITGNKRTGIAPAVPQLLTRKKVMPRIAVIFLLVSASYNLMAQNLPSKNFIDSLKLDAISFLSNQGYLDQGKPLAENLKKVYFFEINDEAILGFNKFGLYVFGVSTSHTRKFILIMNSNTWKLETTEP